MQSVNTEVSLLSGLAISHECYRLVSHHITSLVMWFATQVAVLQVMYANLLVGGHTIASVQCQWQSSGAPAPAAGWVFGLCESGLVIVCTCMCGNCPGIAPELSRRKQQGQGPGIATNATNMARVKATTNAASVVLQVWCCPLTLV